MDLKSIREKLEQKVPPGTELTNPGGGTSTIASYGDEKVAYVRGSSTMYLPFAEIITAYKKFSGKEVSSKTLKEFRPNIYDSAARPAGHSCNCTMLFLLLGEIGLAEQIQGAGKRGDSFRAQFL